MSKRYRPMSYRNPVADFFATAGMVILAIATTIVAVVVGSIKPAVPGLLVLIVGLLIPNGVVIGIGVALLVVALLIGISRFVVAFTSTHYKSRYTR